jgi:hypothetical protein
MLPVVCAWTGKAVTHVVTTIAAATTRRRELILDILLPPDSQCASHEAIGSGFRTRRRRGRRCDGPARMLGWVVTIGFLPVVLLREILGWRGLTTLGALVLSLGWAVLCGA